MLQLEHSGPGSGRRGVAMQKVVNHAKDALHATAQQRERRESAEECRHCLGVGVQRSCCKNYYCNDCYFKGKECPSCGYMFVRRGGRWHPRAAAGDA